MPSKKQKSRGPERDLYTEVLRLRRRYVASSKKIRDYLIERKINEVRIARLEAETQYLVRKLISKKRPSLDLAVAKAKDVAQAREAAVRMGTDTLDGAGSGEGSESEDGETLAALLNVKPSKGSKDLKKKKKKKKKEKKEREKKVEREDSSSEGEETLAALMKPSEGTKKLKSSTKLKEKPKKKRKIEGGAASSEKKKRGNGPSPRPMIPVEYEADGKTPKMPIVFGKGFAIDTLENLGTIVHDSPKYHNMKYIWPVGYRSTRLHSSYIVPDKRVTYTNEIVEGPNGPLFVITAEDDDEKNTANTATAAWTIVLRKVNDARDPEAKRKFNNASGPEYFGLTNPTVKALIEAMPNADKCEMYMISNNGNEEQS